MLCKIGGWASMFTVTNPLLSSHVRFRAENSEELAWVLRDSSGLFQAVLHTLGWKYAGQIVYLHYFHYLQFKLKTLSGRSFVSYHAPGDTSAITVKSWGLHWVETIAAQGKPMTISVTGVQQLCRSTQSHTAMPSSHQLHLPMNSVVAPQQ